MIELEKRRISQNQEFEINFTGDIKRLSGAVQVQYM